MDTEIEIGAQVKKSSNSAFCDHLSANWKKGIDIDQNTSKYITEDILRGYWTTTAVWEIFETSHVKPITSSDNDIIKDYIRVWSTLVFIGNPEQINLFRENGHNDEFFYASGFNATPYLEDNPSLQPMLAEFGEHWGKFWPIRFQPAAIMHQRKLDPKRVLPVTSFRPLLSSTSLTRTKLYEVDLDSSCCGSGNTKVVFKVYTDTSPEANRAFAKEVETFDALGLNCRDVIVEYLGSFIQNGKRVVILEHANGGNLRTFFETHRIPRSNEELIYLWSKLFKLLDALYHLHHPGRSTVGIVHRDIKFENLLFFKKGSSNEFEFDFKLTDFDTSTSLQKVQDGCSRQDNDGSRTHSAPEASRIREITETKAEQVPLNSDVWQLGTVFSEALMCTRWGITALGEYEQKRREETAFSKDLVNSGLEICFHDGEKRLPCIEAFHKKALLNCAKYDEISEPVAALIEKEMLVPHDGRANPKQLSAKFDQLVAQIRSGSATQDRPQNIPIGGLPHRQEITQPPQLPRFNTVPGAISIDQGTTITPQQENVRGRNDRATQSADRISKMGRISEQHNHHGAIETITMPFGGLDITNGCNGEASSGNDRKLTVKTEPGNISQSTKLPKIPVLTISAVDLWRRQKTWGKGGKLPDGMSEIIKELKGRDQLFVVDDALSMKAFLPLVIQVGGAMISIAKKADPDGVELIFASNPDEVKKKRFLTWKSQTDDLVKQINARFDDDSLPASTNMESRLGAVLRRVAASGKDTSVYVLTDGVWVDSKQPGGGVEGPIKNLISRLKDYRRDRDGVTIQFIRFGNDENGQRRLAWLDDKLPESEPSLKDYDIVDTRRHDENLYLLMIGALIRNIDEMK